MPSKNKPRRRGASSSVFIGALFFTSFEYVRKIIIYYILNNEKKSYGGYSRNVIILGKQKNMKFPFLYHLKKNSPHKKREKFLTLQTITNENDT